MFIIAAIAPIVLGVSTLIAMRQLYAGRRVAANDTMALCLTIAGWTMIFAGVAVMFTPIGMIVVSIIFAMSVAKFREGERRALLWTLSAAAERGLPLAPSARAFASRRSDEMARRAWLLAELLDSGMPLPKALAKSGNPLPIDAEVMVHLGTDPKAMVMALRESAQNSGDAEEAWRPILNQTFYLLFVGATACLVATFIMVKIIPTYREIFYDFGTQMPMITIWMIDAANWFSRWWFLLTPIVVYLLSVLLISLFFFIRGKVWIPWPMEWLFGRTDSPSILRGLAVCVAQQLPMHQALSRLGRAYPRKKIAKRLLQASGETATGKYWIDCLQEQQFVTKAEAAVLGAAARAGNLEWALREMSEVGMRRLVYRAKTILNIASPLCLLIVAIPVAWLAVGCFIPLVSLIQNLT